MNATPVDELICKCKHVTYGDVERALARETDFSDVLKTFESIQRETHCSTGCGRCHDRVLDVISEIMMQK